MDSRLFWLALVAFVGATEGGLVAGLLPLISADMGVSMGQAGLIVLGYALVYAIGTPVLAVLLGGVGRRRILAWSEYGVAVCCLLIAASPTLLFIVAARTLLSVFAGTVTGTAMSTAAMIAKPGERGRALQVVTMGQSIASLVGVPLGALLAVQFSWRIDYLIIAAMAGAAATALYLRLPRGLLGDTQSMRDRIRVLRNPGVIPALLTTLLYMVGTFPLVIYVGAVMTDVGIGFEAMALVLLAGGIGAAIASVSAGRIADAMGNRVTVTVAIAAGALCLLAFLLLPLLPQPARLAVLMAILALQGYVAWGYWIAHCSEIAHLAPSSVPVAISLGMAALSIGMAAGAALGGIVVDHWGAIALVYAGLPFVVASLGVWLSIRGQLVAA